MAVDPPECSGSSPPPGGLWHTPGHLKLLHLKQEDKEGGRGWPWTGPEGHGPRGAFQRQVEEWDRSQGCEEDCGRRKRARAGRGGALTGREAAGIPGSRPPGLRSAPSLRPWR